MSTTDSPWGDTGFGPSDDGFASVPTPKTADPDPEPQTSSEDVMSERVRIDPISALPPIAPPPTPTTSRSGRPLVWVGVLALLVLVLAVVGVSWYLTSRSIEEQAFIAADVEVPTQDSDMLAPSDAEMPEVFPIDSVVDAEPENSDMKQSSATAAPPTTSEQVTQPTQPTTSTVAPKPSSKAEPTNREVKQPTTRIPPATTNGPAWVVQVFASPSRDDAEEWLQQLREQRIPDGYIVEQKVKGQSWYRVRFGQFATRSEAEQAAGNRGFAQPWIARVR